LRILAAALLSLFLSLATGLPTRADGGLPAAETVVTTLHAALLNNMKHAQAYGCDGRRKHIEALVDSSFDIPFIAQSALRRHWKDLSDAQRSQYIAAFREDVMVTYAGRFNSYDGETFTTLNSQALPNGDQVVHAKLLPNGDDAVIFDYVLHNKDGGWRIINVVAQGVSDLSLRSTQYASLYDQKGFDGLLAWIQEQTRKTRSNCS
jgi:phospholipid transport system substrate-binding protein